MPRLVLAEDDVLLVEDAAGLLTLAAERSRALVVVEHPHASHRTTEGLDAAR